METFFGDTVGLEFQAFSITHIMLLVSIVLGIYVIYRFREPLRNYKHEKRVRYITATFMILWELSLYLWISVHKGWVWADDLPFLSLCGLALILAIYVLYTKSYRVFEIGYFWAIGGVVSVLFPDIPYMVDRFRFWQFMIGHMVFFYAYMYMLFVHEFKPTFSSFKKSTGILFIYSMIMLIPNAFIETNALFLKESEGTPFEIFEGGPYILYLTGVVLLAFIVMFLWYTPFLIQEKRKKRS